MTQSRIRATESVHCNGTQITVPNPLRPKLLRRLLAENAEISEELGAEGLAHGRNNAILRRFVEISVHRQADHFIA